VVPDGDGVTAPPCAVPRDALTSNEKESHSSILVFVLDPFSLPFFQRGILEVLVLAVVAGFLGTWIVLRGMAFFAHAVGTATFPGLVLADGLGFAAPLGAFGAALVAAALVGLAARRRSVGIDSLTALVLAGALALGVVLASDIFASQASVDRLLFGSLLTIDGGDLALAVAIALVAVVASAIVGPRWLATGFTGEDGSRPAGRAADAGLVVLIALAAVAVLAATGALLATAILVVPAATTRLITDRLHTWQFSTVALAAAEGVCGMWLAYQLNVPPGAAIAVLGGAVFALVAVARTVIPRHPRGAPAAAALMALAALGVAGCGSDDDGAASTSGDAPQMTVAATTTQVGDLVREIGGAAVSVNQILKPNSEAHDYEPRPQDVASVADAKVVFTSGFALDAWSADLVKNSGTEARVVDLSAGLPVTHPAADEEEGDTDPHWWHDPTNVVAAATEVEAALIAADPDAKSEITANADAYRTKVAAVDQAIRACLAQVPEADRKIVTDHDAFVYFTERYGVESVGAVFPATTTQGQPSAGDLAELEQTIRDEKVQAVFPESSLNPKLAERLADDTGVSSDRTLYGDTLGAVGTPEGTILGASAANATAMVEGMTGGKETCKIPV
jgi:ABC-type Zn uptake system ZnuABC Zn-binding protein ZnuA/ABC-type Mn2+/Zn2+ transport system permease subunit